MGAYFGITIAKPQPNKNKPKEIYPYPITLLLRKGFNKRIPVVRKSLHKKVRLRLLVQSPIFSACATIIQDPQIRPAAQKEHGD